MTNHAIAQLLRQVAASYSIKNEQKYRFQILAYQKAADSIEKETTQISDLVKEGRLKGLPGVGPSIQASLEELVKTGKVKHFEDIAKDVPQAMFPLLDIPSFGPKKAFKLVTHFKLTNPNTVLEDVKKLAEDGRIAELPSFGEKSEKDILRAIGEFRKGFGKTTRMVLPYAAEVAEKVLEYLRKSKFVEEAHSLGSLRRRVSTVGDVDIAIATENPQEALEYFVNYPYKERVIEKGTISASILTTGGQQVDVMTQPKASFGSLLQHFTGSKNHNVHLRELALKKGLSLSEKGIKILNTEKMEQYSTEEAFYKRLGMPWIPPEIREDHGEIEAALTNNLPKLVELEDMKGDLHIHSAYPIEPSHDMGHDTMEDMLKRAKELGYEYLGFSEHAPNLSKHTKEQIYSILKKRKEKIEQLNESKKYVRAISLLETDILPNGNLAMDDKALSYVDATIVSIHSVFKTPKKEMTKRILAGLSHPKAKILAHPTGRILNVRLGYEIDFERILEFCKKNNKVLEINSWADTGSARLDLSDIMVKQAIDSGVKMVIDSDSHALWQMDLLKYGVYVARRGWAQKHDILNTLGYNSFIDWLQS